MRRVIIAALSFASATAIASDKPPHAMSVLDAAKLDAALAHEQVIMAQAQAAAQQYEQVVLELCKRYQIDRQDLGTLVSVDVPTGNINRLVPAPVPPKPTPAQPGKK